MLQLLCFAVTVIIIGCIFALPAFIPAMKNVAIRNPAVRRGLMLGLALLAFVVVFSAWSYLRAVIGKVFYEAPACGQEACSGGNRIFPDDPLRDQLLIRELWLLGMTPPSLRKEMCFTGDDVVCNAHIVTMRTEHEGWQTYLESVLIGGLIPALSCAFMVWLITRDGLRKMKHDLE